VDDGDFSHVDVLSDYLSFCRLSNIVFNVALIQNDFSVCWCIVVTYIISGSRKHH